MTQMIELVDRDSKIFSMWSGSYNKLLNRSMEELVNLNAYQQQLCKMKHKKKITGEQKKKKYSIADSVITSSSLLLM